MASIKTDKFDIRELAARIVEDRREIVDRLRAEYAETLAQVEALEGQHERAYARQGELERIARELDVDLKAAPPVAPPPDPQPLAPASRPPSMAPAPFADFHRTPATDLILKILDEHPTGLTAMELARRVRLIRPELKVDSVTSQVYALRNTERLTAVKPKGGPRIFRPIRH